jgi:uncharacterized protein (TIRG00374 family)
MGGHRRQTLARLVGYALSMACLVALAVSVDWAAFLAHLRKAEPLPIVLAMVLVAFTYFLFTLRWRLLLAFEPRLSLYKAASYLMVGYLGNLVLPMRAGDATRVLLVRNEYGSGAARAFGSVLIERVLDVIAVLAVGATVAFTTDLPTPVLAALRIAGFIAATAVWALMWIGTRPAMAITFVERLIRPFSSPRRAHAAADHVRQFADALSIVSPRDRRSALRLGAVIALTACGWSSFGAAMVLCTAALAVHPAVPAGLLMMVVTNLGSAVPSSPGSLGVYHGLAVVALAAWPIGLDAALSVATISHAVVIVVQLLLGLVAFVAIRKNVRVRERVPVAKPDV